MAAPHLTPIKLWCQLIDGQDKDDWCQYIKTNLFFRLQETVGPKLSLVLACLTFFSVNNFAVAATSTQTITIRKPDYQTPIATLEQYAQAILFKKVALAAVTLDWRAFPSLTSEHRTALARHYNLTKSHAFNINSMTLVASRHDSDYYYFSFSFEAPPKISVTVDQDQMAELLGRIGSSGRVDDLAVYLDIGLTDPDLVSTTSLATMWKQHFGYYSYDAVVLSRINHFGAVTFAAKKIALTSLPPDLDDAWQLFDLAPFNWTVCNHLVSRIAPHLVKLRELLIGHCRAIGQVNDEDASWRFKKAQQNSMAIKAELVRLREVFAFDVTARPLFFVLVASNGAFELAPSLITPAVDQYPGGRLGMETSFTPHKLPDQYLPISDMRQLSEFLDKNAMPILAGLFDKVITKHQKDLNDKQRKAVDLPSQFENSYGIF